MLKSIQQIFALALIDLRRRHVDTRLGFAWLLIQPTMTFGIFYLVTVYGFKMGATAGAAPYFAVLFCGLLPWMTLSDSINNAATSLRSRRHLLTDNAVPPVTIVLASVLSPVMLHLLLLAVVLLIFVAGGVPMTAAGIAIVYYYLCLMALCVAVGLLVAPLATRNADVAQIISTIVLVWFWASPIIWVPSTLPESALPYFRLNPFFYIVEGYRGALLLNDPFPAPSAFDAAYWLTVLVLAGLGYGLLRQSAPALREWLHR
ncbi:ABC transporter permease [Aurantimonas sp. MSK8Z-1]|uniref:ABC transporter permease n=1 Tax=Mangrovibrevibacter kandeliae TaxID=2968473 RepID=UPI00211940BB|nr:ABC transporter permease [Aurantimonas sp. MSK8Z-1]MCW4116999.1 ABC transporter permease [Aurantimonas sp. MSK8Z-1]